MVKPTVVGFGASPTTLYDTGGAVTLSATVTGANSCTFTSNRAVTGLTSGACSAGPVTDTVTLPADHGAKPIEFKFKLSVTGATTVKARAVVVNVESTPPPQWPEFHAGPDRTGYQPSETRLGVGTVTSITQARTFPTASSSSPPLIADGMLYTVGSGNKLYAFDAAGASGCSSAPVTCTPLWTASVGYFDGMAIADGVVYVTTAYEVMAFDAAGVTGCSGAPTVCTPLWHTSTNSGSGPGFTSGSGEPVVAGGVLYVPGYGDGIVPAQGGAYIAAFDASGSQGCTLYGSFGNVCVPMWTTIGAPVSTGNSGSVTLANGVLYLADGTLFAFDAAGVKGCSGSPVTCSPLWTSAGSIGITYGAPAVAGGTVLVGTWYGPTFVFSAKGGTTNCKKVGTVKQCSDLWTDTSSGGSGGTPAVANGVAYTVTNLGQLAAFDAAGTTNCTVSGGTKNCTPLWSGASGGGGTVDSSSPAVANGVVYYSSTNGGTYAYDASGVANCTVAAGAKSCTPLWGSVTGYTGGGSPAVVDGVLYVNIAGGVYAYS